MTNNNIVLSQDQEAALREVMSFLYSTTEHELALSGPAGVGKTFLTKLILQKARDPKLAKMLTLIMGQDTQLNVALTSSTNKAATVLSKATWEEAHTVHKTLGLIVKNDYTTGLTKVIKTKKSQVLENTLLIVDEASMVNKQLLTTIREQTHNCKVLYIGDAYQLAPVKENISPVFNEVKNQVKLTTIQRQQAGNSIIPFATQFRKALDTNVFPVIQSLGNNVIHLDSKDFQQQIIKNFHSTMDPEDSRILAWTNGRVHEYNHYVRSLYTSEASFIEGEKLITNRPIMEGDSRIYKGEEVVTISKITPGTAHDLDGWWIYLNGDFGRKHFMARHPEHVQQLTKHYAKHKDWVNYFGVKDFFIDLRPYYACTVNKAQGSTYKDVFIDVTDIGRNTKSNEIARLMYTAVTRASQNIYLRGELPARIY